jgi:hypothetical protein
VLERRLLRYKRKWGAAVKARPENQFDILVRWPAGNDKVAAFLSDVPVLHLQGGGLIAVTTVERTDSATQAAAERIYKEVYMPRIHRIVIVHGAGWGGRCYTAASDGSGSWRAIAGAPGRTAWAGSPPINGRGPASAKRFSKTAQGGHIRPQD